MMIGPSVISLILNTLMHDTYLAAWRAINDHDDVLFFRKQVGRSLVGSVWYFENQRPG